MSCTYYSARRVIEGPGLVCLKSNWGPSRFADQSIRLKILPTLLLFDDYNISSEHLAVNCMMWAGGHKKKVVVKMKGKDAIYDLLSFMC